MRIRERRQERERGLERALDRETTSVCGAHSRPLDVLTLFWLFLVSFDRWALVGTMSGSVDLCL